MSAPPPKPKSISYSGRVVSGAIWLAAARSANLIASLAAIAVLARLIPPADFGIVAAAQVFVALGESLSRGGFAAALVQRTTVTPVHQRAALSASLCVSAAMIAGVIATAPWLERFFGFPGLEAVLLGMSAMLPFRAAATVGLAMLQRDHRFRAITIAAIVAYVFGYAVPAVALAFAGAGVWSLVVGQVCGAVIEATFLTVQARLSLRPSFNRSALHDILSFGGYFFLGATCNWAALHVDRAIVGRLLGAEALGYFSRATTVLSLATTVLGEAVSRVLFPTFSRMQHDVGRLQAAYKRVFAVALPVYFCITAFVILHAEAIVRILLGPNWLAAVAPLQLLFTAFPARNGYKYSESLQIGLGRTGQAALRQFVFFVAIFIGASLGAQADVAGAAAGVSLAIWTFYGVSVTSVSRAVGVSPRWLLLQHGRSLGLALAIGWADACVRALAQGFGFWPAQALSATAFAVLVAAIAALAPARLLGREIGDARTQALDAIRRRRPSKPMPPS